jgi:hypothetical protein
MADHPRRRLALQICWFWNAALPLRLTARLVVWAAVIYWESQLDYVPSASPPCQSERFGRANGIEICLEKTLNERMEHASGIH